MLHSEIVLTMPNNPIWGVFELGFWHSMPNNAIWGQSLEVLLKLPSERKCAHYLKSLDNYIRCLTAQN